LVNEGHFETLKRNT